MQSVHLHAMVVSKSVQFFNATLAILHADWRHDPNPSGTSVERLPTDPPPNREVHEDGLLRHVVGTHMLMLFECYLIFVRG